MTRACAGASDSAATEDDSTLRTRKFELTGTFLEKLEVKRRRKSSQQARAPLMRMSQLVLHDETITAIHMALAQAKHGSTLFEDWGMNGILSYGKGTTILFSGPPGVGKTAAAEAMAHELKKPIIVADYSEIENCWVGETEKRIVRIFREATECDAVLFWDEADAMFFNRDNASRAFEVRHVNVLLQEIERCTSVSILATNRKNSLDSALERRIGLKVEFRRPDGKMRLAIRRKMIPRRMPLGSDVFLDRLADPDLTGAEIRNVVLNAARSALCRGTDGKIEMRDLEEALK